MSERADETVVATFPDRASAAIAAGTLRASGIAAWPRAEGGGSERVQVWVRTTSAHLARELIAARNAQRI